MGDCPCGFSFLTRHDEEDAVAMLQYHIQRIHKKEYPIGVTKTQAMEPIKKQNRLRHQPAIFPLSRISALQRNSRKQLIGVEC
jgi:hypothetical protein